LTLLDSNVLIHYLKGHPQIVARMKSTSRTELAIPTIVAYEIEYGTLRAKLFARRRRELLSVLDPLQQIPFDSAAAVAAAGIRFELEKAGTVIGPLDLLIAGTAVSRAAALVTNNVAEFSRIRGLKVIDWSGA
jgi:tRNA(fMet)-specific endonuclease VapC